MKIVGNQSLYFLHVRPMNRNSKLEQKVRWELDQFEKNILLKSDSKDTSMILNEINQIRKLLDTKKNNTDE